MQIDQVSFPVNGSILFLPRTFTHKIDSSSPFWPYRDALSDAHGQLIVHVCGNDRYLNTEFCDGWAYNMPDARHGRGTKWADIFVTFAGGTAAADMSKFDDVLDHAAHVSPVCGDGALVEPEYGILGHPVAVYFIHTLGAGYIPRSKNPDPLTLVGDPPRPGYGPTLRPRSARGTQSGQRASRRTCRDHITCGEQIYFVSFTPCTPPETRTRWRRAAARPRT